MRLGPYEVLAKLGEGGAAVVYRARTPEGRDVAVKLLKRGDPESVARFEREVRVQGSFDESDGFVPLLGSGRASEGLYLVQPFVPGGTLAERLARGPLPVDDVVALGLALAAALGKAHARGIAHRDLKPQNVLFARDGTPLVSDLGLAKHLAGGLEETFSVTRTGSFGGTAGYAAPEQLRDARSVGPQADVFALGAILHECLAGRPAFGDTSFALVLSRVLEDRRESLAVLRPDAPSWLVSLVERCLAPAAAARFANGSAVAAALEAQEWGPPKKRRAPIAHARLPGREPELELEVPPSSVLTEEAEPRGEVREGVTRTSEQTGYLRRIIGYCQRLFSTQSR